MIWRVTYMWIYIPISVTVEATSEAEAIWEAFRRAEIRDWYMFRRVVREVVCLH